MKHNFKLFASILLCVAFARAIAQPRLRYTFNPTINVKPGLLLPALKNPFTGGFEQPQFSAIDINIDGVLDLLVFDRGTKMTYTFINDAIPNTISYSYVPHFQNRFPDCNSFCLTYDYNNDGKMDYFMESNTMILCFKNISNGFFRLDEPDTLSDFGGVKLFCPGTNIPSFNDIDNDGDMDILSWDPTGYTVNLYKNFRVEQGLNKNQCKFKLVDECWGKFYMSNNLQLGYHCNGLVTFPNGDDYTPPPTPSGANAHAGSTLLTLDVDSDGDYDALLGDIFFNFLYFMKNGKKEFSYAKDTMILKDSMFPNVSQRMEVNYFPAAFFLDVNNDGKRDIIMAPNDAGGASKNANQIYCYINIGTDRKPVFRLIKKNFLQESTIDFGGGSAPTFCDIDNDGDDDLFIASHGEYTETLNTKDRIAMFINKGTLKHPLFVMEDSNFINLIPKKYSSLKPCFGDLNGDGKKDLLIGEANGTLKYYVNTSNGPYISFVENTTQLASFQGRNYSAPYLVDFNRDGKQDLFLGNYDGTVSYYTNTGSVTAPVFSKTIDSVGKICLREIDEFRTFFGDGMSVPVVADLDKNNKFDLLVGGKYGLYLCMNFEDRMNDSLTLEDTVVKFSKLPFAVRKPTGMYVSPAIAMLDSDLVYADIVLGNCGGGISIFTTYDFFSKFGINNTSSKQQSINIYPNPALDIVTIQSEEQEILSMQLLDVTGKAVDVFCLVDRKSVKADISTLPPGLYFVSILTKEGGQQFAKFIKM